MESAPSTGITICRGSRLEVQVEAMKPKPIVGSNQNQYVIRIKELLDPNRSEYLNGMTITQTENGETLLIGVIADQSALHGLLAKIRDLNLTLVSVNRVEPKKE